MVICFIFWRSHLPKGRCDGWYRAKRDEKKVFLITLQLVIQTLSSKAKLSIENFKACPYADILAFGIVVI